MQKFASSSVALNFSHNYEQFFFFFILKSCDVVCVIHNSFASPLKPSKKME